MPYFGGRIQFQSIKLVINYFHPSTHSTFIINIMSIQVRRKVSETVKRLKKEIPGIRIAVIAHGDYCDSYTYVTKILDFTQDEAKICSFVENVESTGACLSLTILFFEFYLALTIIMNSCFLYLLQGITTCVIYHSLQVYGFITEN